MITAFFSASYLPLNWWSFPTASSFASSNAWMNCIPLIIIRHCPSVNSLSGTLKDMGCSAVHGVIAIDFRSLDSPKCESHLCWLSTGSVLQKSSVQGASLSHCSCSRTSLLIQILILTFFRIYRLCWWWAWWIDFAIYLFCSSRCRRGWLHDLTIRFFLYSTVLNILLPLQTPNFTACCWTVMKLNRLSLFAWQKS